MMTKMRISDASPTLTLFLVVALLLGDQSGTVWEIAIDGWWRCLVHE